MDQRNLIIAIVLSVAIVLAFQFLIERPKLERERALHPQATTEATAPSVTGPPVPGASTAPAAPGAIPAEAAAAPRARSRSELLAESPRVEIDTPKLRGSIALQGGRLDDLTLVDYRETVAADSPHITLLTPPGSPEAYYADWGWRAPEGSKAKLPDSSTLWKADRSRLTPTTPVTLTWDNGEGLKFSRVIAIDDAYMFSITQRVENSGPATAALFPYALVSRAGNPPVSGYYLLHEGPLGVFNNTLHDGSWLDKAKINYKDLQTAPYREPTTGGWLGFTDKYWLVAAIPDQHVEVRGSFGDNASEGRNKYQADFITTHELAVAPGQTAEFKSMIFAGAKEVARLDAYESHLGIARLSYAIDWGWFFFLTKPIFYLLDFLYHLVGNFGLAIMLLTVIIKGLFFPLANKSYRSMSKLKKLQPEMTKIRERFGDDRERMNKEMMELYKREKANPVSGCLPQVVMIPVFFALYKVLFVTIEMRQAPFYGWIHDLSVPDPTSILNLFGLLPWAPPAFLSVADIGAWPVIMGITMFLQQKLNPQPADPVQARMFMILPVVFTFMLAHFPSGLVIYWAWNNCLSILQQWLIMRQAGVKP
jgi:YidC/Oxa1 family membrane protein insertase